MARFRKRPVVIDAYTFDEFLAYGREQAPKDAALHNGYPWHFKFHGHPVTHENDNLYLVPTLEGTMNFRRGDMILVGIKGEVYPCEREIFEASYEAA